MNWTKEDDENLDNLTSLLWIIQGSSNMKQGVANYYQRWLESIRDKIKESDN